MLQYHRPETIEEALSLLKDTSAAAIPYSGGTDVLPRWSRGLAPKPEAIVDLKHVRDLRGISGENGEIRIGACMLMSEIAGDSMIQEALPVLAEAANRIACPQIRNRATLGGNLCNASPAADGAIPLILADAVLEVASLEGEGAAMRDISIHDFFQGPGSTALAPGEILVRIRFTPMTPDSFAAWDKFGTRPSMEIAVASVGVGLRLEGGKVTHARVGYGSVAPIPLRGRKAEAALEGNPLDGDTIEKCAAMAGEEISPITDVRASEAYRREIVRVMLRRMLERAKDA
jgi:CO/xanthine dehydrogenase FAD-binding subunit